MNLEYLHLYLLFFPKWTVCIWWIINDQLDDVSTKKLNEYMLINLLVSLLFLVFLNYSVYLFISSHLIILHNLLIVLVSNNQIRDPRRLTIGNEFQLIHVIFVFFFYFLYARIVPVMILCVECVNSAGPNSTQPVS